MNILFISSEQNPFIPPKEGGEQRTQLLLRACANIAHVDVISFASDVISNIPACEVIYAHVISKNKQITRLEKLKSLLKFWDPYSLFPISREKETIIRKVLQAKTYDAIVIRYIPKALECGLLSYVDKLVIDVDDYPADVFKSLARQSSSRRAGLFHQLQALQAKLITNKLLSKVKHSFVPNQEQVYSIKSSYLPNIPFEQTKVCETIDFKAVSNQLFFVGALGYYANELGVEHFLNDIFPKIKHEIPNVEFCIAGKIPSNQLRQKWESIKGVKLLGFVKDITQLYASSKVVVVPIYHGAGTNIKVLEAMHMNRACVVSSFSTRGFKNILIDGVDYLVAKDDNMFVKYVVQLLKNETLNKKIALNGNKKVRQHYSIDAFNNKVATILNNVCN